MRRRRHAKRREGFRPFAPSVLAEDVSEWFDLTAESPYMLLVADVAEKRRRRMSSPASSDERRNPADYFDCSLNW